MFSTGVLDGSDSCPLVSNVAQEDYDGDGVGDECDNCPGDPNNAQTDTNENGYGDECDVVGATDVDMCV